MSWRGERAELWQLFDQGDRRPADGWRRTASTPASTWARAGAGVEDHIHLHVVPRWSGDTNFMPVLADVRVMPEHLTRTLEKLRAAWPAA